jgi:hypothetical protein
MPANSNVGIRAIFVGVFQQNPNEGPTPGCSLQSFEISSDNNSGKLLSLERDMQWHIIILSTFIFQGAGLGAASLDDLISNCVKRFRISTNGYRRSPAGRSYS